MTTSTALELLTNNVNVGMNEIVSVFVSQYEDQLFEKKALLSDRVTKLKAQLKGIDRQVTQPIIVDVYNQRVPGLDVEFKFNKMEVTWDKNYRNDYVSNTIVVSIDLVNCSTGKSLHTITKVLAVPSAFVTLKDELEKDIEKVSAELLSVMTDIKSVSRKERQIRGKLSEMKLAESGFSELLGNPELLKLIQVQ